MEIAAIREAIRRQPFEPFTLALADGRKVPVPHPDFIALPESGRRLAVFEQGGDSLSILEPLLIVSIDYVRTEQSKSNSAGGATQTDGSS